MTPPRRIPLSPTLVLATRDGLKTQTRRVIVPQPGGQPVLCLNVTNNGRPTWMSPAYIQGARMGSTYMLCPYGRVGDLVALTEAFSIVEYGGWDVVVRYLADGAERRVTLDDHARLKMLGDGTTKHPGWRLHHKGRPPMFMFSCLCRTWARLTEIRAERVQEITEEDAKAEGFANRAEFFAAWDRINGKRAGGAYVVERNPWTWPLTYEVVSLDGRPA